MTTPPIADADRVRVRAVHEPTVFYETSSREELASLEAALRTGDPLGAYCMCRGTVLIDVVRGGTSTVITLHHGETLRWDGSPGNIPLVSPDAAMDWLSARGVTFVREEWEAARRRGEENAAAAQRWREAMPSSLVPFFDPTGWNTEVSPECLAALTAEFPDDVERARRMLALYGSGVGRWSGFPSYESVPENILLGMSLDTILAAIGDASDPKIRAGAARFFSDWSFGQKRKKDRKRIPDALKARLLAHVDAAGDSSNAQRAHAALGGHGS